VIYSPVQVCHPKNIGQNGIILYVPAKCVQITSTSMSAYECRSELNDTICSGQVQSINLFKYDCLRPVFRMECYIKLLPSVVKSLAQVCLPKCIDQNGMIKYVTANIYRITCTSMCA
jgi:hypothetical protein